MKILLVRLSSMGDLIHTLPAITDLSKMCPDIQLHWLCEESFADIARLHPFVKKVHVIRWRQWRKQMWQAQMWREMAQIKKILRLEKFDWVLDSQGLIKSAFFAKMAGSPIYGLDKNSARESLAARFYSKTFFVQKGQDAVLRNRLLFAQAFAYEMPSELSFGAVVPESCRLKNREQPYYVALHATSRDSKLWQQENWLALMKMLNQRDGAIIYLPWGNQTEKQRAEQMAQNLPFVKVCDKMNLLQAADLLQQAVGVIGVDTGLLHLANALDKPLVGIYTDTDPKKTGVQVSERAQNIGGINQMPSENEVYQLLLKCME